MTRHRPHAVLLLFLLLNLTACQTWQSVSLDAISPAQLIEEDQLNARGGAAEAADSAVAARLGDRVRFPLPLSGN